MALATNTSPGEIQLAGDLGGNNDATAPELTDLGIAAGQYEFPQITVDAKGRITNISSGNASTLAALLPVATATSSGVIQAGQNLFITANDVAGYQEIAFTISVDGTEASGLATCASYSVTISVDFGAPQILTFDGNDLATINNVVTQINLVLTGATASIITGRIRITSDTTGRTSFVEINDDKIFNCIIDFSQIEISTLGTQSCELNANIATNAQAGAVQVGSGLTIDGTGVLSSNIATGSTLGTVQVGSGLTIDGAGILAADPVPEATTSSKGIVQIGSTIDVAAGIISVGNATNSTKGVVSSANPNNIDITAGAVNVGSDVALLNTSNNWQTSQVVTPAPLVSGATIVVDAAISNTFTVTLDVDAVLQNPTNLLPGGRHTFLITQDATGSRLLTYDTAFKFKNGSDNALTTTANATDILTCVSDGSNLYCSLAKGFI